MKKLRIAGASLIALMSFALLGQSAFAGEWNKGHFNEPGGNVPAKSAAASECVFNGLDEPDETAPGAENGEPLQETEPGSGVYVGDDGDWGATPAGGRVQSGGQITAAAVQATGDPGGFVPTGVQGQACNPTAEPFPEP